VFRTGRASPPLKKGRLEEEPSCEDGSPEQCVYTTPALIRMYDPLTFSIMFHYVSNFQEVKMEVF